MDTTILAAIIGLFGVLLGAITQPLIAELITRKKLRAYGIPDISGQYNGVWYLGANDSRSEYVRDSVDIKLHSGFKVTGTGKDEKGVYRIEGEISLHGMITLSYSYQNSGLSGVAILKIDPLAKVFSGIWYGYLKEQKIDGGHVIWTRVN